jgi:hypothetical protein
MLLTLKSYRKFSSVASDDGIRYAKRYNYQLVNSCVGYVYKEQQQQTKQDLTVFQDIPTNRWNYAVELMISALL